MLYLRRILKYGLVGVLCTGTVISLRNNQYQIDSLGIVRFSRAAYTVFQIGIIYRRDLYGKHLDKHSEEYKLQKSLCHKKSAEKLLELCCTNKGVYIKVGQHIAALDYLLPMEYVQTMKILHCNAPSNPIEDVEQVLREEFGSKMEKIFTKIERKPLGSASLAQVHKAYLSDGSVVAVKVQHPYVLGNARVDLKTMEYMVNIMGWIFPEFKFQWLVKETKKNIPQELDFANEGKNAEKISRMFSGVRWLRVPKIRWDLTTSRVLTMEFLEGGQVNDLDYIKNNKIDPYEVSDKLGRLYSQMIFINGFVHSDPHPGNIFVRKSNNGECDIVLLDHGLYATLTDQFRLEYSNLWLSILNRDRKAMRAHCKNLGIEGDLYGLFTCMVTGRTWDTIVQGIDKQIPTKGEKEFLQNEFPNIIPQISSILDRVNRQMLLILKTNDLMRGIEYTLQTNTRMGAFKVMSECCVRSIYNEKINAAHTKTERFKVRIAQYWALIKLNLYYKFIRLGKIGSMFFQ